VISKNKGDIAELKVMLYLEQKGFTVLTPFGDKARYDVVYERDGIFKRVQVKYVTMKDGIIEVYTESTNEKDGKRICKYYTSKEIDEFWIYCPQTDKLYSIPILDVERQRSLRLRVDKPKKEVNTIRYADDYELQ